MVKFLIFVLGGICMVSQAHTVTINVAVGSTNPIKVRAVKNAFGDEEVNVLPCAALSHVRNQPLSNEETAAGVRPF